MPALPPGGPAAALPPSPFAPCPPPANRLVARVRSCRAASRAFAHPPDAVFAATVAALRTVRGLEVGHAEAVEADAAARRAHAVFRVVLFRDDVEAAVVPHGGGAVLHLRSAQRVGKGDFGVNGRRVRRLLDAVARTLGG